ncbi:MAG: hypothetical protein ACYCXP_07215 [Leptospirillum sp.]
MQESPVSEKKIQDDTFLISFLTVAVSYPVLMRAMMLRAHPVRLKMIALGGELLQSEKLTDLQKKMVKFSMKESLRLYPMILVVCIMSGYLVMNGLTKNSPKFPGDPELERKYATFQELQGKSVMFANPVFSLLAVLEVFFYLTIKRQWSTFIHNKVMLAKFVSLTFTLFEKNKLDHATV